MNIHRNAPLALARRIEMVQDTALNGLGVCAAAQAHVVSESAARNWLGRYLALALAPALGWAGVVDACMPPANAPPAIEPAKALVVAELCRKRLAQVRTAARWA